MLAKNVFINRSNRQSAVETMNKVAEQLIREKVYIYNMISETIPSLGIPLGMNRRLCTCTPKGRALTKRTVLSSPSKKEPFI